MSSALSRIQGTCHDFDGVFYNPHDIPNYDQHFNLGVAQTIFQMFGDIVDDKEALKLNAEWYGRYGDSVTGMLEWADKKGLSSPTLCSDFFGKFHQNLYRIFMQANPTALTQPSVDLVAAFQKTNDRVKSGIATHACANEWARPLLPQLGIQPYIQDHAIFGLEDSGFLRKSTDADLVRMCLKALDVEPAAAAYIEDTAVNLKTNKEAEPKLTTVFLNHGRPLDSKPSHIDFEFKNLAEYQAALNAALSAPRKLILV